MRLNKYIASRTNLSRRAADEAIEKGKVLVNGNQPIQGQDTGPQDEVKLNGRLLNSDKPETITIILNKPTGYVCSRDGQGNRTIYDSLPKKYHNLNPAGRLDKDSSGLLLMSNDGNLINQLTHPSNKKVKIYEIEIDKSLSPLHQQMINDKGIKLADGVSKLNLEKLANSRQFRVAMYEGRNRQIRRTFDALDYRVTKLHRTHFGPYQLIDLKPGQIKKLV